MKFVLTNRDPSLTELVHHTPQKILALWAIACAERVMPYFEDAFPEDNRPRDALATLETWIATGTFSMKAIRHASLASHEAARDVGEDSPARSVAHAAGQAVATAHVPTHSEGAALYALQALSRTVKTGSWENVVGRERDWQYRKLLELRETAGFPSQNVQSR